MQFLLVHSSSDRPVTSTHPSTGNACELFTPGNKQKSPQFCLEETKAGKPAATVPVLQNPHDQNGLDHQHTPISEDTCEVGPEPGFEESPVSALTTTTLPWADLPLAPQRSCLATGFLGPGLALCEVIHISDDNNFLV